ncbi:MAG TPA: ribose ABC transporter substrate-binding protein RbsB [Symbiobacteriaceae bacterium]|nr:ribose ABC transporter substrate-binding protein RbsB [Symbiobacteriaceae bacterium]
MKRFTWLMVAVFLMAILTACGGTAQKTETKPADTPAAAPAKKTIGLAVSTLNNPFFVDLRDGAKAAADAAGVELIVLDAQNDAAKQTAQVEDLITKKVDVILINPADSDAIATAIAAANKANIPVITVDRGANKGTVAAHVASDNVAGGKMAGELIVQLTGGKGQIAELEGIPGTSAARDRGTGFHQAVDNKADLKVVAKQPADFDRAKGLKTMENILQANPDIVAVFAHNDEMALGALEAIKAAGKEGKISVVGFDATDDAVKAVKEKKMAATVAQKPKDIGRIGVESAVKVMNGQSVEKNIPVALELVK